MNYLGLVLSKSKQAIFKFVLVTEKVGFRSKRENSWGENDEELQRAEEKAFRYKQLEGATYTAEARYEDAAGFAYDL